ncbi:hypothetical protein MAM1_1250c11536 [Mucor ambiguus]|uniref:Uncharacterized protein n=1 Tax=Mucor ambiguus TaxID=91626 RepID=A0A0C9MMA7_9FUNG|nr:hypothetical protein MAM1_1250c11536 [Mucor ambiguus]
MLYLGVHRCCDCGSLAVLAMLSLCNLALFAAPPVAVYLLSWCCCLVGACFCCLLSFTCCLGAVYYCCCCSLIIAVLVKHSLASATASIYYWLSWRCSVVLMLSSAGVIIRWNFWFVLCCVDVPIAEAQH